MPKFESVEIMGRDAAPAEDVLMTLNRNGLVDDSNRKLPFFTTISKELIATSVDTHLWTCPEGVWELVRAEAFVDVTGSTGADVMVEVCSGIVAVTAGIDQLTAVMDIEIVGPVKVLGTLIATPTPMQPGDNLTVYFTGTLTGLIGSLTLTLKRTS